MSMIDVKEKVALDNLVTFRIGGPASYFCVVKSLEDLRAAASYARNKQIPILILGGGSNLLVSDNGFDGLVIKNEITVLDSREIDTEKILVKAGSGNNWDELVGFAVARGWSGLENLSGIPGTVGGAVVQNAGAYGVETKETVLMVEVLNLETDQIEVFYNQQCDFSYRHSLFKEKKNFVILSATFVLGKKARTELQYRDLQKYFNEKQSSQPSPGEIREAVLQIRKNKLPDIKMLGSAGSYFKNPIISTEKYEILVKKFPGLPGYPEADQKNTKISLAWVLDNICHLKGHRSRDIGLYEKQPIILVNYGQATAAEVVNFAQEIKNSVQEKIGVVIEEEVEKIN